MTSRHVQINIHRTLSFALIIGGMALRLRQYLANRSLWLDECFLALNLRDRALVDLLDPLDWGQGAPIGFLLMEKLSVFAFGSGELSLRLFPCCAGLVALPLFWLLARRCVKPGAVLLALALLSSTEFVVYYSSEVKQYSTDVLVAVILLLLGNGVRREVKVGGSGGGWGLLAGVGAFLIWFSHASVFVLGSILVALALAFRGIDRRLLSRLALTAVLWGAALSFDYFVSLRHLAGSTHLHTYWKSAFIRLPPSSFSEFRATVEVLLRFFQDPAGLTLAGLSGFSTVVGAVSMWKRDRSMALMLQMPAWLALLASTLRLYPFEGRLLLFLVPAAFLLLAEGVEEMRSLLWNRFRLAGVCLVVALVYHPLLDAYDYARRPRMREELRQVLEGIVEQHAPDDLVYVCGTSQWGFAYYAPRVGLQDTPHMIGQILDDDTGRIHEELASLIGRGRVWFVFSSGGKGADVGTPERIYLDYLESIGLRISCIGAHGASAYLYDL